MQETMEKCSERCGWTGRIRTGWIICSREWAEEAQVPQKRIRDRGGFLEYRRRLRDAACPGCGVRGLDRCQRISG